MLNCNCCKVFRPICGCGWYWLWLVSGIRGSFTLAPLYDSEDTKKELFECSHFPAFYFGFSLFRHTHSLANNTTIRFFLTSFYISNSYPFFVTHLVPSLLPTLSTTCAQRRQCDEWSNLYKVSCWHLFDRNNASERVVCQDCPYPLIVHRIVQHSALQSLFPPLLKSFGCLVAVFS